MPAGSIVFGPDAGYFFPVEQSGSRYLYLEDDLTPGLVRGDDSTSYRERYLDAAACDAPTCIVWPRGGDSLPAEAAMRPRLELNIGDSGPLNLLPFYRMERPSDCTAQQVDVTAMMPFGKL
jgi:hypothetical protein